MHEQLVGYLCGALEIEEMEIVERSLHENGEIRRRLLILRLAFVPLEYDREDCLPPAGLAARVCQKMRCRRN